MGVSIRCKRIASQINRILSEIQSEFIKSFERGKILRILSPLTSTRMFDPKLSKTSIESTDLNSQGLAKKAYGLEVSAPLKKN
jgi:hypothetical protein